MVRFAFSRLLALTAVPVLAANAAATAGEVESVNGEGRTVVWNVRDDFGAVGDGLTDDFAAIQLALDSANSGDTIFFPPASVGYRIASGSTLEVPDLGLTLLGDGWLSGGAPTRSNNYATGVFSASRILRSEASPFGAMVNLHGNVEINGLHFDGNFYGRFHFDPDAEGIQCWGNRFAAFTNVTIRNCLIENFTTRGIAINGVNDGIIDNCLIRRCDLGGVYLSLVRRWHVYNSAAVDVGDSQSGGVPFGNHYPFVVTAIPGQASCRDVIIFNCYVDHNPNWIGILDHGTQNWLAFYCRVNDSQSGINDASYVNHTLNKDEHHTIDCIAENIANGWGIDIYSVEKRGSLIGNRVIDHATAPSNIYVFDCPVKPVVTWNRCSGGYALAGSMDPLKSGQAITQWTSGHNRLRGGRISLADWSNLDGAPVTQTNSPLPPAPRGLKANQNGSDVVLNWRYAKSDNHDSFYIERSSNGETGWQRVAYTPPNNGLWDYDAPTNPNWISFDPLSFRHHNTVGGHYRIRVNNGERFSVWDYSTGQP
ncbi:MAG: right-handed parallel beta-helix repeat-containing protein [Planctomycetes bacterium]|nr:right-handed parallel beta-helix repeat-containing protein [Planctomycetota bacterium]